MMMATISPTSLQCSFQKTQRDDLACRHGDNTRRMDQQPQPRKEAAGVGWQEHFVDKEKAPFSVSVGVAVAQCLSYVTIANFATLGERSCLQESALEVQRDCSIADDDNTTKNGIHILGASQVNFNCTRASVKAHLSRDAKVASAVLLDRLLGFLESDMSDLALQVFGCKESNLKKLQVTWYSEPADESGQLYSEPKVNLYGLGGYFRRHEDGMQLTILVTLNDSFEGGGTAFYVQGNEDDNERHGSEKDPEAGMVPGSICRPPGGTAIIWGGALVHMALPVTTGMRAVYVGSFSLNS